MTWLAALLLFLCFFMVKITWRYRQGKEPWAKYYKSTTLLFLVREVH